MPRRARLDARPACPDLAGPRLSSRWRAGPWDIASRAHILLRSSEFGLSGFRNYVEKGVNEGRRPELVGGGLIREKASIEELTSSSRRKEVSVIRGRIAIGLVEK
jgi:hypothetical protein